MIKKTKKLIIYGESAYALMLACYFQTDSPYEVVAFCVDKAYKTKDEIEGIPVVVLENIEQYYASDEHAMFAAIGYKSVRTHKQLFEKIAKLSFPIASYISSQAIVDTTCNVGVNCLVLAGSIIEPGVRIENNCFVNSGAIICHHATIKAHSILASGSLIGGHSTVGECSLIGFHATVAELLELGEETLVAAGSVLLEHTEKHTMYAGTPAKVIKKHSDTGIVIIPQALQNKG